MVEPGLYDARLDSSDYRQKLFEQILVALCNQRTKEGKRFHIDVSRLRHEYLSLEQDVKARQT